MIEAYFEDRLQELLISPAVSAFRVLREIISEEDGYIRVKCDLQNGDLLELSEYVQAHIDQIDLVTYSYHWQTSDGALIRRWDNVPHHRQFATFPHHLHLPNGKVCSSVATNLGKVILEIQETLRKPESE